MGVQANPLWIRHWPTDKFGIKQASTRNIFKKDIRRLSNTDDKRNQIRWF